MTMTNPDPHTFLRPYVQANYLTQTAARRRSCDLCGDDQTELRLFTFGGWVPDEAWCRECYSTHDEHEYTDFPLVKEATQ